VIRGALKYIASRGYASELYDLACDPYELQNLAGQEETRALEEAMRACLLEEQRRTGDPEGLV
jgi:hypothetical protein